MSHFVGVRALALVGAVIAGFAIGVPNAFAAFHGVGSAKTCTSPTKIGVAYVCSGQILNTVDQGFDTIEVTGLSDTVNASGGSVPSGEILPSVGLIFGGTGTVTCTGHVSGDGSPGSPWLGADDCLLTFGATITTTQFSHYAVQPGDYNIATTAKLASPANVGNTTITLTTPPTAVIGNTIVIDPTGAHPETRVVSAVNVGAKQLSFTTPLGFTHAAGTTVNQFAHRLTDSLQWGWNNTCEFNPDNDCTSDPQFTTVGASTLVQKLDSATTTQIHDAA